MVFNITFSPVDLWFFILRVDDHHSKFAYRDQWTSMHITIAVYVSCLSMGSSFIVFCYISVKELLLQQIKVKMAPKQAKHCLPTMVVPIVKGRLMDLETRDQKLIPLHQSMTWMGKKVESDKHKEHILVQFCNLVSIIVRWLKGVTLLKGMFNKLCWTCSILIMCYFNLIYLLLTNILPFQFSIVLIKYCPWPNWISELLLDNLDI